MILVDTTIWSLALRRRPQQLSTAETQLVAHWADLARKGLVALAGPIRQEVLSGVRHRAQFDALRKALNDFHSIGVTDADFERAAELFNRCRVHGISAGGVDMLICAIAAEHRCPIFTTDPDFARYARHIADLKVYEAFRA
jgi:predicted nucleic acid-binding protein